VEQELSYFLLHSEPFAAVAKADPQTRHRQKKDRRLEYVSRLRFFVSEHFRVFLCASADSASCGIISLDSALQIDIGSIEVRLRRRQLSEHPPGRFEKVHVGVDAD
jgi:hypothetical protein